MAHRPNDSKRPIHVIHAMTSLEAGGLENGVVNLANGLDEDHFRTSIICLERIGEFRERLRSGVAVECLWKPPGFRPVAGVRLARRLNDHHADILHTHNLGPLTYGAIARRWGGFRGAVVQGEHAQLREDEKILKRRWMRRVGYQVCDAVHTVSNGLREELINLGLPSGKIRTILNGVDCGHFTPVGKAEILELRRSRGLPDSAFVIGIVGRFGASKRHERLVEAFDRLAGEFRELFLLMVGDHGPQKETVMSRCDRSPFRNRIHRAGFQDDPVPWYRMMDLLVIPSENEGLSNAMLEAMACGLPCLAHPACGAVEVIHDGENGFLRPLGDMSRLAEELRRLLENRGELEALGIKARRTAVERFSLESMLEGYSQLYREVAS